jgi:hypothetical protein
MSRSHVITLGALYGLAAGGAHAAAKGPTAGEWYRVNGYVSAVSSACTGGAMVGNTPNGRFYYAGPGKTGSLLYTYKSVTPPGAPDVNRVSTPTMPSASATPATGSFSSTKLMSGDVTNGTMTVTLTYGDADAFFMTVTSNVTTSGGGTCTQTDEFTATHSSK